MVLSRQNVKFFYADAIILTKKLEKNRFIDFQFLSSIITHSEQNTQKRLCAKNDVFVNKGVKLLIYSAKYLFELPVIHQNLTFEEWIRWT